MNLDLIPLAFESPRYLSTASAWVEHIPFAFTLIDLLRPAAFVELGTHMGDSYCAFCQAVDTRALPTRCTAIDTWQGDRHAGYTGGDTILADLRRYHDPLYARFSTLLQSTFDQAAPRFPDLSIDLLHIDGLHTYDAVRHDFETWRLRLSDRAVVLFHDTQERHDDFGVYRLWAELAKRFPSFEFHHGHGLGVLAVGSKVPARFGEFLDAARHDPEATRRIFATLGSRFEMQRQLSLARPRILRDTSLSLYWPNPQGRLDAAHASTIFLTPDGQAKRLTLRAELPPQASGGATLRLDPGETPGFWLIERLAMAVSRQGSDPMTCNATLRSGPGVVLIPTKDPAGAQGCVLFCLVNDPQVELALTFPAPPAGEALPIFFELTVDCRAWDSFGALTAGGPAGLPLAQALRTLLERARP